MFQLSKDEFDNWKSQFVTSNADTMRLRRPPNAFSEQGVAMLSAILKSEKAIKISIQIINAFVSMRKFILTNAQIFQRLKSLEKKQIETDKKFSDLFNAMESKASPR